MRDEHPIEEQHPIEADKPENLLEEAIQEMNAAMLEELQEDEEPTEYRITIAGQLYVVDLKALQAEIEALGEEPMTGLTSPEQWRREYEQEPLPERRFLPYPDPFGRRPFIARNPGPMDVARPALNVFGGPCWMCQYWRVDQEQGQAYVLEPASDRKATSPTLSWGHCTSFGTETSGSRWNISCFSPRPEGQLEDGCCCDCTGECEQCES